MGSYRPAQYADMGGMDGFLTAKKLKAIEFFRVFIYNIQV